MNSSHAANSHSRPCLLGNTAKSHWSQLPKIPIQLVLLCLHFPPREEAACGLLRFKFTIKMRFFFFPTFAANDFMVAGLARLPAPQGVQMVSPWRWNSSLLPFQKCMLWKECAMFCKYLSYRYKFIYLLLEFELLFFVNADTYKVTSCGISVYIWHACLQTQLNWPLFFPPPLMIHQQLLS